MKISYNWLKKYLDIIPEPTEVRELLTSCGLEVEALEKFETVRGGLEGIVIGEVKSKQKHPDADKLSLTTVDTGSDKLLSIVCGAPNVDAGQKVLVATIGATLYQGDKEFKISKTKIRGQVSEGMICSEDELGLGTSHEGIMVLDASAKVGMPAKEYFNIQDDYVFEIGLTPNRADAASHLGVARDLYAVLVCKGKKVKFQEPSVESFASDRKGSTVQVVVEDNKECPRYSGLSVSNIEIKESPEWLKNILKAIGIRPINSIVDITNFVLFETGQPLHAFDESKIKGNKIVVRKLKKGTKFTTLDEVERELTGNELMICNSEEGMCIAGVFGGLDSGISDKTRNVFLESAYFNAVSVRKTSKHHGLNTDSSFRFERGTDPDKTIYALKRAALLIKEIAGGECCEIIDVYPEKIEKCKVEIKYDNIDRLTGKQIEKPLIKNILTSLGMEVISENKEGMTISVPLSKVDVRREADVLEDILRIYGYNNIEIPQEVRMSLPLINKPDKENIQNAISDYLSSNGFNEIMCNSLTDSGYTGESKDIKPGRNVKILNPLSNNLDVLRQTLLFGGLESIAYNQNRQNYDLKLYEFGNIYYLSGNNKSGDLSKYGEEFRLALFVTGRRHQESWNTGDDNVDFFYLKAFVNNILKLCNIDTDKLEVKTGSSEVFASSMAYISEGVRIAEFGLVSDRIQKKFDSRNEIFFADISWEHILKHLKYDSVKYKEAPRFPAVRRDLALLLDKNRTFSEIRQIAYNTEKKLLKNISLFDIYEGEKIEQGKKSYAVSFILQDEEKTLTDKVIDGVMQKLIKAFEKELGAVIR